MNTTDNTLLQNPEYNPNALLDDLLTNLCLSTDAALARKMGVAPPVISKIRHKTLPIGHSFILRAHDITLRTANDLRRLAGIPITLNT